jgi:hypothetical protein
VMKWCLGEYQKIMWADRAAEVVEEHGEGFEELEECVEAVVVAGRIHPGILGVDAIGEVTMDEVELWGQSRTQPKR